MKYSGFNNVEDTHLTHLDRLNRIERLFAVIYMGVFDWNTQTLIYSKAREKSKKHIQIWTGRYC
jgi:hypothetical protein